METALIETHISTVVFVGDRAYKLKKPLRFPFADLSTREARQALCHREVELNRRFAPDVYEGVADVIGPDGVLCDHLVVMRRLPDERRLSAMVTAGDLRCRAAIRDVARQFADFEASADRSPDIDADATRDAVAERWRQNFEQMRSLVGVVFDRDRLNRAVELADRFLAGRSELFDFRIAQGHVRDGHGDLQAADIFVLDDGARILDCIEFDDHLRHIDFVDELAFLVMDLEHLGAPELADELVRYFESATGLEVPAPLLNHYVAYRAQVRAMVLALRGVQHSSGEDRGRDVAEAGRFLDQCLARLEAGIVRVVLVGGLPGTGKTTLARMLATRAGYALVQSDVVREHTRDEPDAERGPVPFGSGPYTEAGVNRTYDTIFERVRHGLASASSVVVDASFIAERHRDQARAVARDAGAEMVELRCAVGADVAADRIRRRLAEGRDESEADPDVAAHMADVEEPWPQSTEIRTDGPLSVVVDRALDIMGLPRATA